MSTLVLPKDTARVLRDLTGESRPDIALYWSSVMLWLIGWSKSRRDCVPLQQNMK